MATDKIRAGGSREALRVTMLGRRHIERAADTAAVPARQAIRLVRLIRTAFTNYVEHRSAPISAAIAFHALLSVAPMVLLVSSALGFWIKSDPNAYQKVLQFFEAMLPVRPPVEIERELATMVASRGIAVGVGVIALIWLSSNVFHLVNEAITEASGEKRRFVRSRLMGMLMTVLLAVLLLIGFGFSWLVGMVGDLAQARQVSWAYSIKTHWYIVHSAVTVFVSGLTFTTIYKLLPPKRVRLRAAMCGGFGTALTWEVSRRLFTWYVTYYAPYQSIYGSLTNLVVLALWAYYSAMLLLLGAELTFAFENERELVGGGVTPPSGASDCNAPAHPGG